MAQEDKRDAEQGAAPADDATQLKKRARRRLIGAIALAMLAAIVLPMVMDHQPAPALRDIQVRIPSPDEGVTQRVATKPVAAPVKLKEEKPVPLPAAELAPASRETAAMPPAIPITKPDAKPETKPAPVAESKAEPKAEVKPEANAEGKPAVENWEVQLGAYQEPGRVKLLVGKLKELGIPTYTEKVDTPNGARTRVRAGPYPSQEAAEKARTRVKIVGVDGPVVRKP
jgi:DedD protein